MDGNVRQAETNSGAAGFGARDFNEIKSWIHNRAMLAKSENSWDFESQPHILLKYVLNLSNWAQSEKVRINLKTLRILCPKSDADNFVLTKTSKANKFLFIIDFLFSLSNLSPCIIYFDPFMIIARIVFGLLNIYFDTWRRQCEMKLVTRLSRLTPIQFHSTEILLRKVIKIIRNWVRISLNYGPWHGCDGLKKIWNQNYLFNSETSNFETISLFWSTFVNIKWILLNINHYLRVVTNGMNGKIEVKVDLLISQMNW